MSSKTIRRRSLGALVAATAVGALAVPATGVAGVAAIQDDVLTTAPLDSIPTRIDMVKQTKAKVTRIDILWSLVAPTAPANPTDPNDPAYDWSRLDAIFTALTQSGITPIVSTYSTPDWAVAGRNIPHPRTQYNPNAPKAAAFAAFMQAVPRGTTARSPAPTVRLRLSTASISANFRLISQVIPQTSALPARDQVQVPQFREDWFEPTQRRTVAANRTQRIP